MNTSLLKRGFVLSLILTLLLLTFSPVSMAYNKYQANAVFPEKEISKLLDQINQQEISYDKAANLFRSLSNSDMTKAGNDTPGIYPTRTGVILVTPDKFLNFLPLGHSAIIKTSSTVVESTARGVVMGPNNWNKTKKQCYAVTVRETTEEEDCEASNWCFGQLRKPYNFNYLNIWTRSRFYCSQLIWAAFLDNYGINLDTSAFGHAIHPLELVTSPKTDLIFTK